ncbi:MAG: hypothetical protein RJA49_1532 [Actinomycetota bacterium]
MTPFSPRRRLHIVAALLFAAAAVMAAAPTATAGMVTPQSLGTLDFTYTGAPETWTVPAGITSIVATVCGASGENLLLGGSAHKLSGRPGHGGCVTAAVRVAPGDVVNVRVGGHATSDAGGWPDGGLMTCPGVFCGGGGGGSSDIRVGGDTLTDRVLVGGGGGGGGAGVLGGAGGDAGGGTSTIGFNGANGGAGGGMLDPALTDVMGGQGGTLAQVWNGGCGIVGTDGLTPNCAHNDRPAWNVPPGRSGAANQGGNSSPANAGIGGAGGGGYFGGGSGCGYSDFGQTDLGTCGGGGGSSYADQTRTAYEFLDQGTMNWYTDWLNGVTTRGDNGTVSISWPGPEVPAFVPTTTTVAPATTAAPTTAAPTTAVAANSSVVSTTATPTTIDPFPTDLVLPATGSRGTGSSVPLAVVLLAAGSTLVVLARRRTTP